MFFRGGREIKIYEIKYWVSTHFSKSFRWSLSFFSSVKSNGVWMGEGHRKLKVKCHMWGAYASTSLWLPCQWHNIHPSTYIWMGQSGGNEWTDFKFNNSFGHHQKIYWPVVQNVWLLFIIHMILIQKWCKQFNMEQHMERIYIYTGPWEELITHTV